MNTVTQRRFHYDGKFCLLVAGLLLGCAKFRDVENWEALHSLDDLGMYFGASL